MSPDFRLEIEMLNVDPSQVTPVGHGQALRSTPANRSVETPVLWRSRSSVNLLAER